MALILENNDENISRAADSIVNNDIVIFPTETVYGIGANAFSKIAIEKIYNFKKRPTTNPLILHVLNWEMGRLFTNLSELEDKIVENLVKLWPGPLTLLVKSNDNVLKEINNNSNWIAIRSPSNCIARKLLSKCNVPIVAPSANISGMTSSTELSHIEYYFKNNKDITILKQNEPCKLGTESTILKIDNNQLTIVRPGIILKSEIKNQLQTIEDNLLINESLYFNQENFHPHHKL